MGADLLLAHCELPWDAKAMRPILLERIEQASSDKSVHSYLEDVLYSEFEELEQELEEISESDLFSVFIFNICAIFSSFSLSDSTGPSMVGESISVFVISLI